METPNRPSKSTEADPKPVRGGHIRWSGARGARNRPAPLRPAGAGKGPPTAAALASCSASSCWIWPARGGTMPSARVAEVAAPAPRLGATELPNQPICKSTTVSRLHLQGRVQVCGPPTKTSSLPLPPSSERPPDEQFAPCYPDGGSEELLISTPCAVDCSARPTSSLFIARSGGRKSCAGAAAGARAWARAAGLGG